MAYKIAVASSDGVNVDRTFGEALSFTIYEVDGENVSYLEKRDAGTEKVSTNTSCETNELNCQSGCKGGGGCGGNSSEKVEIISDCRAIVCKKIGFGIQKHLERKAISAFDVSVTVDEAIKKITYYYLRIDRRESLRKLY